MRANEKICKRVSSGEVGETKSAKCRHELGSLKRSRGETPALPAEKQLSLLAALRSSRKASAAAAKVAPRQNN